MTYSWKVLLTGGPLGQARENVTMEEAPAKVVAAAGELRPGRWVPAVYYFGQWLPVPVVKWDTLACGGGPLLALGVIGLILRCVIGPRALPNHYEPATRDYSADFTGVPTLRPALLGVVGLIGFLALSTGLLGKRVVAPGSHFCYWLAMLGLSLFLISGPVVIWCVLPHFHRVIAPDG